MPILCEPGALFDVVLESDKDKANPPTFVCKAQSIRGQQKISVVLDKLTDGQTTITELFDETLATLAEVVDGWKNMPTAYSKDELANWLNYGECRELLRGVLYNSQVSAETKKN